MAQQPAGPEASPAAAKGPAPGQPEPVLRLGLCDLGAAVLGWATRRLGRCLAGAAACSGHPAVPERTNTTQKTYFLR